MNFAEQDVNEKGIDIYSVEERKMIRMRDLKIRLSMLVELEECRKELDLLLRYHGCIINNCPKEDYPPMPLPIPSDYAENLARVETAEKGILAP